jgi:hypothetical protein
MLAATPERAGFIFATAVVLGDANRVAVGLGRNADLATRRDPRSGWTALHVACASRWHQFEPARAEGLLAVVRLLLDAGAGPLAATTGARAGWTPLRCAIASANSGPSNLPVVELLLQGGAVPDDHDLYLAGFAHDRRELLPVLLARLRRPDKIRQALPAPLANAPRSASCSGPTTSPFGVTRRGRARSGIASARDAQLGPHGCSARRRRGCRRDRAPAPRLQP